MMKAMKCIDPLAVAAAMALMLFFSSAYAAPECVGNNACSPTSNTTNNAGGSAVAGAIAGAAAGASVDSRISNHNANIQGQLQAQEQAAIAVSEGSKASSTTGASTSGSSSGGNALTVNTQYAAPNMREMVPSVAIGGLYPSSPCMGTSNAGGSGPGFSVAIGTSWKDDDCGVRETARSFAGMGMNADALAVLCSSQYAKAAPSCAKAEAVKKAEGQPDQKRRTSDEPVRTSARECVSDPIIALRMGAPVCK